jgi:two-component system OmpR family sensor kinase
MGRRPVTLRFRLVAALAALVAVGLVIFGVSTYKFYADSQYDHLDDQLVDLSLKVTPRLLYPQEGQPGPVGLEEYVAQRRYISNGTYADAKIVPVDEDADLPDLPERIAFDGHARFTDVGSTAGGSTHWRVLIAPAHKPDGPGGPFPGISDPTSDRYFIVLAMPTTSIHSSLRKLATVEIVSGVGLLVLMAFGAWLLMRRGLKPLEKMASTAHTLTAGRLDTRVEPADDHTEIGQLGLALNTMLGRLQGAFAEREATELKLRQFLADASHELRTPLTSIQGFAELFRLGADEDQVDMAVTMRRIEEESDRMSVLVDELLLLARLDQRRPLHHEPVDLAVVAADACSDAVAVDPERAVTLDAPAPVVVQGDNDHLRQAVGNLVSNALRHTPAGSPVEVAARAVDGSALVIVRDHGPGLADDALAHAFDRFWQADSSRADEGAGLGLSIVAAIATEHGGSAWASNAVDGGAVFTLRLPVATNGVNSSD